MSRNLMVLVIRCFLGFVYMAVGILADPQRFLFSLSGICPDSEKDERMNVSYGWDMEIEDRRIEGGKIDNKRRVARSDWHRGEQGRVKVRRLLGTTELNDAARGRRSFRSHLRWVSPPYIDKLVAFFSFLPLPLLFLLDSLIYLSRRALFFSISFFSNAFTRSRAMDHILHGSLIVELHSRV